MKTRRELKETLGKLLEAMDFDDLEVTVEEGRGRRLVAVVTTPDFEGMAESERQSLVWEKVYNEFNDEEQTRIDFIFTNTPSEEEEMETGGQAAPSR